MVCSGMRTNPSTWDTTLTTLPSYAEACAWMLQNPGQVATWDSGAGWTSVGYYDRKLRRYMLRSSNAKGGECC